jgi:hypothetical protein
MENHVCKCLFAYGIVPQFARRLDLIVCWTLLGGYTITVSVLLGIASAVRKCCSLVSCSVHSFISCSLPPQSPTTRFNNRTLYPWHVSV